VGAVSRHISLLEAHFGQILLRRHRAGVSPTDAGTAYLQTVGAAFDAISHAGSAMRDDAVGATRLRLSLYTTFTSEWLSARLTTFRAENPGMEFDVSLSTGEHGLRPQDFDIALTVSPPENRTGLRIDALFDLVVTLVCAPHLANGPPTIHHAGDLADQMLLFTPRERRMWKPLLAALGSSPLDQSRLMEFDTLGLTLQAARAGGGVALGNLFFVVDDFRAGKLCAPFDLAVRFNAPHYLVCAEQRADQPAIARFRTWLMAQAGQTNQLMADFLADRVVIDGIL